MVFTETLGVHIVIHRSHVFCVVATVAAQACYTLAVLRPHTGSECEKSAHSWCLGLQVLHEEQEVLLVSSVTDLEAQQHCSWPLHYILRPANDGCSMLLRRSGIFLHVTHTHSHAAYWRSGCNDLSVSETALL